MNLGIVSLILLLAAIALGFFRKTNVGLVALLLSLLFGRYIGLTDAAILKGFKASLFITLMGVTLLFSILNNNGTIELLAKKIVSLTGKNNYLLPICMFALGFALTTVGPGAIPILAIMPAFAVPIAKAHGYNPLMLAFIGCFGAFGGRVSSITPEGILTYDVLQQFGIPTAQALPQIYAAQTVTALLMAVAAFIYYKGYKPLSVTETKEETCQPFNKKQLLSLLGLIITTVSVIAFKFNVGIMSFAVSAVLLCCQVADEQKCIKAVPWGVLIMVSGVSALMNLVIQTGGIKTLTAALTTFMNTRTASAIMVSTASIMSLFSSGLGVVFPTLLPTVQEIGHSVGVSPIQMASMVLIGGTATGISPISSAGGLILATMMADAGQEKKADEMKIFMELTGWAIAILLGLIAISWLGAYNLIFK